MDQNNQKFVSRVVLVLGAIATIAMMVAIIALLTKVFASGMSNQAINKRANLGLVRRPLYHDVEGATAIEYGLTNRLAALQNLRPLSRFRSGFEGLATTKKVRDPWRHANPYTMMMR